MTCPVLTRDTQMTLKAMAVGEWLEAVADVHPAMQTIPALSRELGSPFEPIDPVAHSDGTRRARRIQPKAHRQATGGA
jgi:TusA-related sulfurtransferase